MAEAHIIDQKISVLFSAGLSLATLDMNYLNSGLEKNKDYNVHRNPFASLISKKETNTGKLINEIKNFITDAQKPNKPIHHL